MNIRNFFRIFTRKRSRKYLCVQCGACCKVGTCAYGVWVPEKGQCVFLTEDMRCWVYDYIKHDQASPAMGAGCCMPVLNDLREKRVKAILDINPKFKEYTYEKN